MKQIIQFLGENKSFEKTITSISPITIPNVGESVLFGNVMFVTRTRTFGFVEKDKDNEMTWCIFLTGDFLPLAEKQ